jgi:activator of HSP90 ATPase
MHCASPTSAGWHKMKNGFTLSETIRAKPAEIYEAWLSTEGHTAMTGSPAKVDGKVAGQFSAWDGYIFGKTLELTPHQRIVQAWRTTEFPDDAPDSHLEVLLDEGTEGTKVTLIHSDMPEDQVDSYRQGWEDFYFKPMKVYFK